MVAIGLVLASAACNGEPGGTMTDNQPIAIVGATALFGPDLVPISDAVIVIAGDLIEAVGPEEEVPVPDDAVIVPGAGLTAMPGFIDAHVHIGLVEPGDVLAGGVTTVRDLAWPPDDIFSLVQQAQDPDWRGPGIVAAGPMVTVAGGYPTRAEWAPEGTGRIVAGSTDAPGVVRELVAAGATVIKVALNPPAGPTLDADTLTAIVTEAHAAGLRVTAHVYGLSELHKALDAGVDELAHMLMSPKRIPDDTIRRMVDADMTIVPTLAIRFRRDARIATDNLKRFAAAGGRVIYGTDLGNAGPQPGIDGREINAMKRAGLDASAIIGSATVQAADWLGLANIGSLETGKQADIVLVAGDPFHRIRALTDVVMVFRKGVKTR